MPLRGEPTMGTEAIDPNVWADAALKLFHGGGWVVPILIGWWIFWRYNPWRKKAEP